MCQRTWTSVMVQKSLYHERYWERSAWKTNRVDDHDVVALSADMRAVLSLNSDWWLLRQIAQILIMIWLPCF